MNPTESHVGNSIQDVDDVDTFEKLLSDLEIECQKYYHHSLLHTVIKLIDYGKWESDKQLNPFNWSKADRRFVEALLESSTFNVDALTESAETVLHFAVKYGSCKDFSSKAYNDTFSAVIDLLLKKNARINAKNSYGQTPLMMASYNGSTHIVKLLLDWRDKLGAEVDLNARDENGETALFKAAKHAHVDVIKLLLQHGCLDKFQNHRGFYALHAVIYGSGVIRNDKKDFLALIGELASEETPKVLRQYAALNGVPHWIFDELRGNDLIQETVSLLVTRGGAEINSLDFGGNTVLDLALKSKLCISQNTVKKLKEYGATSSCAILNKHSEYPKHITLQYTDKLGKTPFHRLSVLLPKLNLREMIEMFEFDRLLNSSPNKDAFEEMTVAKDRRARTVLHYAVMPTGISLSSEDIFLLIKVLKLKPTINERDHYRRSPLHYCQDKDVYRTLVKQGADERIPDIDGKTPQDLNKLRNEECDRYNLRSKLKDEVSKEKTDAWMIWTDSEYAYRDQFSRNICDKVQHFMNRLSEEIRKRDPRFECRPVLIGSAEEGTKTGLPDEFDFNFILTELSEVCEVVRSPEAPSGFVHVKRKSCSAEYRPTSQEFQRQDGFDGLFNICGFLLTPEIACMFRILYLQVMSDPEFWEGEDFFEWDQFNEVGSSYDQYNAITSADVLCATHPCSSIQLKLNRPIKGRYMFALISLDILPCIQIKGFWPEEALSSLSDKMKFEGCHLVFDQPQRHYPWVPFSDPFARISFAPAEDRIIKECSAVARAAYMVGKQLLYYQGKPKLTYVLKTCLLYCVEALKGCTSNSLLYEDIIPAELRFFVQKLMLCFHKFYLQDFLPCYMMPSFHLPIEGNVKSNHDKLWYDSSFQYPSFAHTLYSKVCTAECTEDFCPPTPEPLSEKFDREELMRKLSIDRSYIEHVGVIYRRV